MRPSEGVLGEGLKRKVVEQRGERGIYRAGKRRLARACAFAEDQKRLNDNVGMQLNDNAIFGKPLNLYNHQQLQIYSQKFEICEFFKCKH
jgi:hypothetical protein